MQQRQRAVVRRHHQLAAGEQRHHGFALGADAGIDHRDEDCLARPVVHHGLQTIGGLPDVERGNLVRQVVDDEIRRHEPGDAAHRAHGVVA